MKLIKRKKMDLVRVFVPIERVDEEKREVTGYAFVNEVVEGEGGVRLKRSSMQAATPDYTEWGCIREMHGDNAAGTAVSVVWDKKGALLTAKIVDDGAWKKCVERVYKGFSVGVRAVEMRGLNVEKARWVETSLVDRPADPDAKISLVRADVTDDGGKQDVDIIQDGADDESPKALKRRIKELEKQIAGQGGGDDDGGEVAQLITRVSTLETTVKDLASLTKAQRKEIKRLSKQPASTPPVRYPQALNREFAGNEGASDKDGTEAELAEYNKLKETLGNEADPEKRHKGVSKLNGIKASLMQKGLNV